MGKGQVLACCSSSILLFFSSQMGLAVEVPQAERPCLASSYSATSVSATMRTAIRNDSCRVDMTFTKIVWTHGSRPMQLALCVGRK
ncbi:hypothetical protein RRG08_055522 [Elysia crispata]|uniref:Secreted protein n=1 Tax=Elysia crispata TaxID=231223 RepID=A0AAE1APH6_9GAST|nr:hypothetical protein RRG08_055522 [Elysia crispata]